MKESPVQWRSSGAKDCSLCFYRDFNRDEFTCRGCVSFNRFIPRDTYLTEELPMMEYNKDFNKQHPDYDPNNLKRKLPTEDAVKSSTEALKQAIERHERGHKERAIREMKEEYAKAETAEAPWPFPKPAPDRMKEPYGCGEQTQEAPKLSEYGKIKQELLDALKAPLETPLETQVAGTHYKGLKIQPIEYIHANNLSYCEANVVKYITRWRSKGGKQDLEKVKHYVDLLIQLEAL